MKKSLIKINKKIKKVVTIGRVPMIEVPMYRCAVEILFKKPTEKLEKEWDNVIDYGGQTRNYLRDEGKVMITFPKDNPDMSTVVHELCHASQMILKHCGHNYYDSSCDEPFAYLLGYLVEEYQNIKKKKK
jgi:hypothetical protein